MALSRHRADEPSGRPSGRSGRALFQLAAVIGIAALSWQFIENPIRRGALGPLWSALKQRRYARQPLPRRSRVAVAGAGTVFVSALAGLAGLGVQTSQSQVPGRLTLARTVTASTQRLPRRTSCTSVVHIGDSTSEGLVSREYLPNPRQLISARYARVGVHTQHFEISGGRSIYERVQGAPNANEVASAWKSRGFRGCWVLALGTNETANVSAGSAVGLDQRINSMMSTLGDAPVMWVNVKSLVTGPYSATNMQLWNDALRGPATDTRTCASTTGPKRYRTPWFVSDGIHFTSEGYAARGRLIAHALLAAFPVRGGRILADPGA